MKIVISGASGLVGSHLAVSLREAGHEVVTLVRRPVRQPGEVFWAPDTGELDPAALTGVEAAVNLSGAGIGDKRWSADYKKTVLDSRVRSTELLAGALAQLDPLPSVLLSGSAVGFYGDTGDRSVDETAPVGEGFLAEVCVAWEQATSVAESAGIRTCHLRTGIVLDASGGALKKQLLLYKIGIGGPLGSGRQFQSWISLADEVGAIIFLLTAGGVSGPVNLSAPEPVTQKAFAQALGSVLHRPALLPTPALAIKLALGGFADEGVLHGQRVLPAVLERAGYSFEHRTLRPALDATLG